MAIDIGAQEALDKALHEVGRLTIENLFLREELARRPPADAFERAQEILRGEVPQDSPETNLGEVKGPDG